MYVPRHFKEDDPETLFALIDAYPFGALILPTREGLEISHVPFIVDRDVGPNGRLRCHIARANPWWKHAAPGIAAVAVFQGPSAYISPDWYASEHQVPTWNYAAVHVTGQPRLLDNDDALTRLLDDLSAQEEARLAPKKPWTSGKMPEDLYKGMRKAIVGVEIPIDRIEGKWKMSQNRKPEDQDGAIRALRAVGGDANTRVADIMAAVARETEE